MARAGADIRSARSTLPCVDFGIHPASGRGRAEESMSKTKIELVTKTDAARLISRSMGDKLTDEGRKNLAKCSDCTTTVWAGYVDEELVCIWGLVPPTLLSEMAYLWLHTTEGVKDHEFVFVGRSQRAIQKGVKIDPLLW